MYELSLFTGAGGGLLGTHLLGWTPIGYVEWNDYCQRIIAARIADGILPNAPIFTDVRQFVQSGAAEQYRGIADVVTAGFPCQPFSVAGKRAGADDERNMWPETAECIRIVRPRYAFLENVPALINSGYFERVLGDMAEMGMDARWGVFPACAFGAPHTRERLFIVAYSNGIGINGRRKRTRSATSFERRDQSERGKCNTARRRFAKTEIWDTKEADILRMADGLDSKMERIRAIGNGQVPAVVRAAWELLTAERI